MLKDLILKNRSYRKFKADQAVERDTLLELIDLARFAPSSKNRQPLKYILVNDTKKSDFVFEHLKWAWYIRNWDGPSPSERPPAYIIMLLDKELNDKADFDAGIAAQSILLGATEKGLGGCIIRTVNRYELSKYFDLPNQFDIVLIIALGIPAEEIQIDDQDTKGNMEYWRDENDVHHVPKRPLSELIYE